MRLSVCVFVALVGVAAGRGPAAAQLARYPRQQPPPAPPAASDQLAPLVAKGIADLPATTAPSIHADDVMSIDGLRGGIRTEQEQILVELIANTPDSEVEEKSDYYFRLGELYAKQQRFWHDKTIELTAAGNQKEAALAASKAKEFLLKTVKTYKGLTGNEAFRNYPKMDVALFYYAYTLQSGKYMKEARAVYDLLVKTYPSSKYIPEAHLAFADYYAEAGQLADAEERYRKVLEFPKSGVYAYALYRIGWIQLQLQRPQEALTAFANVVRVTKNDRKQEALYRAAKTDFVRASIATGKRERALPAIETLARENTDVLDIYADMAWEQGASEQIIAAYRALSTREPADERACVWQYRITRATLSLPKSTTAMKEMTALGRFVSDKVEADPDCRADTLEMASQLAATYVVDWSKTQNAAKLEDAEQLYAMLVTAAPDDVDARAQYAEVLWARADHETNAKLRREKWQRAADVFAAIGTAEAAEAAALGWMNALDIVVPADAKVTLAKSTRKAPRPLPLPAAETKLLTAIASYASQASADDDQLAQMRLAAAITWRKYRHFDEAVAMLDAFLEHHQAHPRAELAANLLLDSMVQRGKPDETFDVVEAIAGDLAFLNGKPELVRNIGLLRARSLHAAR
ncbi:MAG TPA: hypothetical protein VMZ53_05200 [Kofleriaceae bacterium]|nr:hypothetical protein [Kofleriaceae bacterium]